LCVEMAIIKLCYLNQAVEITSGNADGIVKKKLVDAAKPVSFKALSFIKVKEVAPIAITAKKEVVQPATLIIETEKAVVKNMPSQAVPETKAMGFGMLSKMKAQIIEENKKEINALSLTLENLQIAWIKYTEKIEAEKKHPTVTQFKAAELRIDDENNFTIITEGKVQQKFIENERSGLITFVQKYFNNKLLKYSMEIIEQETGEMNETKILTSKQQYQLLIEKYPLIKELRDRLRLELD
jgi:DNA polymerase III subunit gamma/tau